MKTEPIGVTFVVPENQEAIGVYESENGIEVFETDAPYLLSDGKSLVNPLPVKVVDGPVFLDAMGNAQAAMAVSGLTSAWPPLNLFANGEAGFWLSYQPDHLYADVDKTVPATLGGGIASFDDLSGNGVTGPQSVSTARPIFRASPARGEYDLADDVLPKDATLAAGTYTIALATREGIYFDTVTHAGGPFSIGPTTYTNGPAGILTALSTDGALHIIGALLVDRELTAEEKARVVSYWQSKGAGSADLYGDDFVMFVETTTASETFTIPTQDVGTFNATIDWGDGSSNTITAYNAPELTHTYASAGTQRICISGTFPNIYFNASGDSLKVKGIANWGSVGFETLYRAFYGCSNMQFALQLGNCNTSSVTSLGDMFRNCSNLTTLDVSGFDTSSAVLMSSMFRNCSNLTTLDVSGFDTSSVTNMSNMFNNCTSLGPLTISGWNISSLTVATSFMSNAANALTQTEYEAALVAWEAQTEQPNVEIHFGDATYTAGSAATARAALVANGWTITDGGPA